MKYLLVSLTTLLLFACSSGPVQKTEYGPNVGERRVNNLIAEIKKNKNCQSDSYEYVYIKDNIHAIEACNQQFQYALVCPGYCFWLSFDDLKSRASFDLSCDDEVKVTRINDSLWGVSGCGSKATYIPMFTNRQMTWVLNGSSASFNAASQANQNQAAANAASQAAQDAANAANHHIIHHTPPPPPPAPAPPPMF